MNDRLDKLASESSNKAYESFDSSLVVRWEFIECHKAAFKAGFQACLESTEVRALVEALEEIAKGNFVDYSDAEADARAALKAYRAATEKAGEE